MNCDSSWFDDRAILSYKKNIVLSANTYKFLFCAKASRRSRSRRKIPAEHCSDKGDPVFSIASATPKPARVIDWVNEWVRQSAILFWSFLLYFWTLKTVLCVKLWKCRIYKSDCDSLFWVVRAWANPASLRGSYLKAIRTNTEQPSKIYIIVNTILATSHLR